MGIRTVIAVTAALGALAVWWYGFEFVPTPTNQQDVVTASGVIP